MNLDIDLLSRLPHLQRDGTPAVLVTVVQTRGSTPRKPGARMLLVADGRREGTIGGGAVEHVVIQAAQQVLASGEPQLLEYNLTTELAMCCGGQMSFFLEPIIAAPTLIVLGCGHVGLAVIEAAAPLGFRIVAVDDLIENANKERLPQATEIINSYEPSELADALPFGPDAYVVIATRQHALDQKLIELCLRHPSRYLGVIGSMRKAHTQRSRLQAKGFTDGDIARVHCPAGVEVGAQTPAEIAVSICAELVQVRRGQAPQEPVR